MKPRENARSAEHELPHLTAALSPPSEGAERENLFAPCVFCCGQRIRVYSCPSVVKNKWLTFSPKQSGRT
jgi:hypothetical protein